MFIGVAKIHRHHRRRTLDRFQASREIRRHRAAARAATTCQIYLRRRSDCPLQLVSGYKGTSEIRLAFNSGEVSGVSNSWESTKSTWRKEVESGEMIELRFRATPSRTRSWPKFPVSSTWRKPTKPRNSCEVVLQAHGPTVRPFVVPPRTPKDRVQILRKAFMDTMKDPEFLAETKKANLDINPDRRRDPRTKRHRDLEARTSADRQAERYFEVATSRGRRPFRASPRLDQDVET